MYLPIPTLLSPILNGDPSLLSDIPHDVYITFHVPIELWLIEVYVASTPLAAVACVARRICRDCGYEEESKEGESDREMHFW